MANDENDAQALARVREEDEANPRSPLTPYNRHWHKNGGNRFALLSSDLKGKKVRSIKDIFSTVYYKYTYLKEPNFNLHTSSRSYYAFNDINLASQDAWINHGEECHEGAAEEIENSIKDNESDERWGTELSVN